MEAGIVLIILIVLSVPLAIIWLIRRALEARQRLDDQSLKISVLESQVQRLQQQREKAQPAQPATAQTPQPAVISPPPFVPVPPPQPVGVLEEEIFVPEPMVSSLVPPVLDPPPLPDSNPEPVYEPVAPQKTKPPINWEQFMGVKGFAWAGGVALFLAVVFFIKYSFDNNLVSPELRVAIGFITGLGLLVGGVVMSRKNFPALSQTLCATGVVVLYAITFACRSLYHFEFFGPVPTFMLMVLITATAFFLAVRLNALVVAILGMLGGFITPVLLSTGQDNPLGLFGYIAILDAGLMIVALYRRWYFLSALAAFGTAIMEAGWAEKFFEREKYFEGNKILTALIVLLGFGILWLISNWWAKRREQTNQWFSGSALGLVAGAFIFNGWFLTFPPLAQRPWLMFGFIFLIDLVAITITLLDKKVSVAQSLSGFATFILLGLWTGKSLSSDLLNAALAFYFIFAVLHSGLPAFLKRRGNPEFATPANQFFPILALVLVLVPVFKLTEISFIVWPFILLVDLLAIAMAVVTSTLLPVLAVLLLTLAATGALIFKIPADLTGLPTSFFLLGAFVIFFVIAGIWLVKKFKPDAFKSGMKINAEFTGPEDLAAILPACSIVLPFLLLIMASQRLQLVNPSPVFGLALLLVVLLFGVTKLFSLDWLPAIGLGCVAALECVWHFAHFHPENPTQPLNLILAWYVIFLAVFALFPFLFLKQFSGKVIPWAAAALAGLPQFFLIHRFVLSVHPNQVMGLLPAAFAIPGLLSLVIVLKKIPSENKARLSQLAWFGGVALFFITLIFPIQFDRQWITIGWALEGVALLWLFHRVPHPGLRFTGVGLLIAAFARLAFNPAVLEYHQRSATPVFNWYLYAYGVVTICLFTGTRLLAPPRNIVLKRNIQPILDGMGTILAFLLMNIEIADYFSAPGSRLAFQFGGNFAREMTYTISWALFALVMIVIGIIKKNAVARYAAMVLLCVTLLKLFFHDLANLNQLYRIGAFIGVAVIAMLASFAYQKFFNAGNKPKESKDETSQ